jgi:protein TonB
MLIPKFDLCKSEWLELVFDDRNKQYGAYELRQHNGRTMVKAMLIAFISVTSVAILVGVLIKPAVVKAGENFISHPVLLFHYVKPPVVVPPKPINHVRTSVTPAVTTPTVVHQWAPMVVVDDHHAVDPLKNKDLQNGAIGSLNVNGPSNTIPTNGGGGTPGVTPGPANTESAPFTSVEIMPVPYGGASAWSKFLSKNLRYPDMAIDQHIQGKVWVTFIIEADGTLSHFKVDKGVGYGLDEEALRVLKLAPAWKPGMQNGHPVRVQYTIPINFQLSEEQ